MNRRLAWITGAVAVGSAVGLTNTLVFRGSFFSYFVAVIGIYVAVSLIVVACIMIFLSRYWHRSRFRWACGISAALAGIALAPAAFLPAGYLLQKSDIRKARTYCENLAVKLESAKAETGSYPPSIHALLSKSGPLPRLLSAKFYTSDGQSYSFEFEVDDGFLPTVHTYHSTDRVWREYS